MKKMFLALIAIGVLATSANAWWIQGGTVKWMEVQDGGLVFVNINYNGNDYNYRFSGSPEVIKTMTAAAMTASASGQLLAAQIESSAITNLYLYGAGVTP